MNIEVNDAIALDYKNGMRVFEISKKYNKASPNIISLLKTRGLFVPLNNRFSKDEIEIIRENYPTSDRDTMLSFLPGRKWEDILTKASKLGVKKEAKWSDEDIETLRDACLRGCSTKEIINIFNGRFAACVIDCKISKLRLLRRTPWSDLEMNLIKDYYETLPIDDLCAMLPGRTRDTIKTYGNKLGLVSKNWIDRMSSIASYRDLCHFLRSNNHIWKQESMVACDYKCVISGERFDDVHHLVGFNQIFAEMVLDHPEIRLCETVQEYSLEELEYILSCFLRIQATYPLGACLTKNVHTEFHSTYGFGNNTEAQFLEFFNHYNTTNPVTITA